MDEVMKVLLAPDKFKGSRTAAQVVHHLGSGLAARGIAYHGLPLADGGDGSVQAAITAGFRSITIQVAGATGAPHLTQVAFDGTTAVIEVANTCGLQTLTGATLAPLDSSSRGVGEAVDAVLPWGAKRIVLALGGSASTDGGGGMLAALGAVFRDRSGHRLRINGGALHRIHTVDTTAMRDLSDVELLIASDVQNPLTGPNGAAATYGPQKGATAQDVRALDDGLNHLVRCMAAAGHPGATHLARTGGAGAAGGVGYAGLLLGARVVSGADYFLDLLDFDGHLRGCDLVITGEGKMDVQTLQGKLPAMVARRAGDIPVIAIVGRSEIDEQARLSLGFQAVHALADHTQGNPATDPALSASLLEQLGRTIALPPHAATPHGSSHETICSA
jgi:glycerate 2-kinase